MSRTSMWLPDILKSNFGTFKKTCRSNSLYLNVICSPRGSRWLTGEIGGASINVLETINVQLHILHQITPSSPGAITCTHRILCNSVIKASQTRY